jgi:ABC-type nitrate/sulfonate/bicarbonate transport system ATPase subunit
MQSELLRIWEQEKKTVVFVTHSIDEALLLSDRIVVMKEGTVVTTVEVPIEQPRTRESLLEHKEAIELRRELIEML